MLFQFNTFTSVDVIMNQTGLLFFWDTRYVETKQSFNASLFSSCLMENVYFHISLPR